MLIIFSVLAGVYSAVPPPASVRKAPAAPAASKAEDSDSSDSSDDEEEEKKVAGKRCPTVKAQSLSVSHDQSNSLVILTAKKPTPAKTPAAKPAAKKQESSSESSGTDQTPSRSFST